MKVLKSGHIYELDHRDGKNTTKIAYVNKESGSEAEGVISQEVLRMLIDRTRYCNNCLPHPNNERIIYHLRMALVLHEARALERKVQKDEIEPEFVETGTDGHYKLATTFTEYKNYTTNLIPYEHEWNKKPIYTIDS